jgi:hypothetical protein
MSIAHVEHVPQTLHQAVVAVFRDDPALAFDLVGLVFGASCLCSARFEIARASWVALRRVSAIPASSGPTSCSRR